MKRESKKRVLSLFMTFIFTLNTFTSVIAAEVNGRPETQKGKYYGKELAQKQKVKDINGESSKTQKSLKKPQTSTKKVTDAANKKGLQEKVEKRTENSKTYKIDDKHEVTDIYLDKVHYKDGQGNFQDIDNTLVGTGKDGKEAYENKANDFKATFPAVVTKDKGINITENGESITYIPIEGDFSKSAVNQNAILYNDVLSGIDYQYSVQNSSVKEDIILNHYVDKNVFKYYVSTNGLELKAEGNTIKAYEKGKNTLAFILNAPVMTDAAGKKSFNLKINLEKDSQQRDIISITVDKGWLQAKDRAYPVKIDPDTVKIDNVETACLEENSPDTITTNNDYIYVGYEDGTHTSYAVDGNIVGFGTTETVVKFDPTSYVSTDQKVTSAVLNIYRYLVEDTTPRDIELYNIDIPIDINNLSWANTHPNNSLFGGNITYATKATISGPADGSAALTSWDVTNLVSGWLSGKANNGVVLKYPDESLKQTAVPLSGGANNEDCGSAPYVEITKEYNNPVDTNTSLDSPTVKLRPITEHTNEGILHLDAVFADGVAKPGAAVAYSLEPIGDTAYMGITGASYSYEYPNGTAFQSSFPSGYLYMSKESNWQTNWFLPSWRQDQTSGLKLNTLYRIKAVATLDGQVGSPGYSEYFQVYQVQAKDTIPYIANFYGVSVDTIMADNKVADRLLVEGNTLFIRNPQKNVGKAYTPGPMTDAQKREIDAALMGRGKHCEFGFEPINLNTGNFYYTAEDAKLPDLNGDFTISRSYNAIGDLHNGYFGARWNFDFDKSLSMVQGETIVYSRGDGSAIYFKKNADGSYSAPAGEHYTLTKNTSSDGSDISFYLTENGNITYSFNTMGLLKSITDKKGNVTTLNYDAAYRLASIVSPSGRSYSISVNDSGRIDTITLPNSAKLSYSYDDNGNLTAFTDANGNTTKYNYDENGRMTSSIDPNGNTAVSNTYDAQGRVLKQTDAKGNSITINYFDGHNDTYDGNGNKTTYYFDSNFRTTKIVRPDGKTVEKTYDENNNVKTVKDALDEVTTYEYDGNGNTTKETRFDGKSRIYTYDSNNNQTSATDFNGNKTSMDYDSKGNLLKITKADGSTQELTYNDKNQMVTSKDADGKVTTYEYTGADVTKITDPKGNTYNYYYNPLGKVITVEDPKGNLSRLSYSPGGELLNTVLPGGSVTEYIYDNNGNDLSITDAANNITTFEYDKLNKLIKATDPLGNATTYSYDANGNKTEQQDARGYKTQYQYDSLSRVTKMIDSNGGETVYERDALGNITAATDPMGNKSTYVYDYAVNKVEKITGTLGQTLSNEYDAEGNVLKVTLPDGTSKQYGYDSLYRVTDFTDVTGIKTHTTYDGEGRITKIEDSNGKVYQYQYDDNGNLLNTVDPLGYQVKYTYNNNNQMSSTTDEDGNTTNYSYNAVGKVTGIVDSAGNNKSYEYDVNGNLVTQKDAKGAVTTYYYDQLNRLKAVKDALENITQYSYDASGNINKKTDPVGSETNYEYDGKGLPVKVTDALNGTYEISYDKNGNRTQIKNPLSGITSLEYDAVGRLTAQTDPAGLKKNFQYDSMNRLIKTEDNGGNTITNTYDSFGRLLQQKDAIGRTVKYEYDSAGNIVKKTDADGNITTYQYDLRGRVTKITDVENKVTEVKYDGLDNILEKILPGSKDYKYSYDAAGNLVKAIDPLSAETNYKYDANNNLTEVKNAKGNTKKYEYNAINRLSAFIDERNNKTLYEYDPNNNVKKVTDAAGNVTQYLYDNLNRLVTEVNALGFNTEYQYDGLGNLTAQTDGRGNKTSYEYNSHGMQTKVTDALGGVTKYEYNINDSLTKKTDALNAQYNYTYDTAQRITSVTDPAGYVMNFGYDSLGNVEKEYDSEGNIKSYTYDKMHRLLSEKNTAGNITSYSYNDIGNLSSVKQPNGNTTFYQYDVMDRINKITDPEGKMTQISYDSLGNVQSVVKPGNQAYKYEYDETNNLKASTNPLGQTTTYTYNQNNQLETETNPLGNKVTYSYNPLTMLSQVKDQLGNTTSYGYDASGNLAAVTDGNNNTTKYDYDPLNRLTKVTNALGNETGYTYDAVGNRTSITDGNGHVTKYSYNNTGKLTSVQNPAGEAESYTYNLVGTISSYTKPDGSKEKYNYDTLNRLVSKEYVDNKGNTEQNKTVNYKYDISGNRIYMEGNEGETNYSYDSMERMTSVNLPTGEEVKYQYDDLGRKSKLIYPDGKYVNYSYDDLNRLISVQNWKGEKTSYSYDAAGRRSEILLPNGVTAKFTYDAADRVIKVENTGAEGIVSTFDYSYDGAGNIINEVQYQGDETYNRTYTYDTANEITGFTEEEKDEDGSTETRRYSFGYDKAGNRIAVEIKDGDGDSKVTNYTYNAADELISELTGKFTTKYEYDKNGNRIRKIMPDARVIYYDYDEENRLTQLTNYNGYVETYGYDSDGNRMYATSGYYFQPQVADTSQDGTGGTAGNGGGSSSSGSTAGSSGDSSSAGNTAGAVTNSSAISKDDTAAGNAASTSGSTVADNTTPDSKTTADAKENGGDSSTAGAIKNNKRTAKKSQASGNLLNKIGRAVSSFVNSVKNAAGKAINAAGKFFSGVGKAIGKFFKGVGNYIKNLFAGKKSAENAQSSTTVKVSMKVFGSSNSSGGNSGKGNGNSDDKSNSTGNNGNNSGKDSSNGNGNSSGKADNGLGNSGQGKGNGNGNGNGNSNANGGNGQANDKANNGKDNSTDNNGSSSSNGKHNGWDKNKDKGSKLKSNNGLHLGWYKRADQPNNPANSQTASDASYQITNYINDISLQNAQVIETSNKDGVYDRAYTNGLERISEDNLTMTDDIKYDPLYYVNDGRGNVTELTDGRGVTRDRYRYDPYGVPIPKATIGPNPVDFANSYRYNGEDTDIVTGLQYLRARYYEPTSGRFLTRDSYLGDVTSPLTLNRYAYAVNNPIMYSDPSGHRIMPLTASYEEAYSENTSPLLQNGDTGDSVVDLQNRLMNLGYTLNGGADGKFGSSTESAVRAFQESKNLSMKDGIVGNETWGALLSGSSSASSGAANPESNGLLRMGSSGGAVTKLQQTLMGLGYDLGSYGADGIFGTKTEEAVRAFQDHSQIEVDGIVGNQTWAALAAASRPNAVSQNGCGTSDHIGNGDYDYKTGNVQGTGNAAIDLSKLKPEDVTREIAEWLIANPVNVFATQHPYITQALTGVDVLGLFYAGGFVMDGDGVYHARQEWSLQSFEYSGFNDFYDTVFRYATDMNNAKFQFSDDEGNDYILWAWKGDYLNLGAGAEMGIYKNMDVGGKSTKHWLVDKSLAMPMTLKLDYNGKQIISYDPKKVDPQIFDPLRKSTDKWWVTGFDPDYQDVKASQLKATYTVDFSDKQDLYKYFIKSRDYLNNLDKWSISEDNKYKMTFTFK